MNPEDEQDEIIDRFIRHEAGSPSQDFTERVLDRIGETRQPSRIYILSRWILPLAACLAFAFVLPDLLEKGGKPDVPVAPITDEFAFDDILLLAQPLGEEASLMLDEETLELFALLAE